MLDVTAPCGVGPTTKRFMEHDYYCRTWICPIMHALRVRFLDSHVSNTEASMGPDYATRQQLIPERITPESLVPESTWRSSTT